MKKNNTKIEKQALPVVIDLATGEPVAIVYFSPNRERIIYLTRKADEDDIVELLTTPPPETQTEV